MTIRKVIKFVVKDSYGQNQEFATLKQAKEAALQEKIVEFLAANDFSRHEAYIVIRAIRDHRSELLALFDEPLEPVDETLEPSE